jgi:hypothetical protein
MIDHGRLSALSQKIHQGTATKAELGVMLEQRFRQTFD